MIATLLGLAVGLILALTGAGGGIIAVPLLIFGLGWDVAHAGPVALFSVGASAALGAAMGLRTGIVRYRAAILISVTGALFAPLGMMLAHRIPATPLAVTFSVVLLYVALRMFRQARAAQRGEPDEAINAAACKLDQSTGRFRWTARCARNMMGTGALTGFLSGLLGVGGGFVIVPALRRNTDLPMNAIIASSLMVIALVSGATVLSSALAGHVDFAVALPFAAGAVAGMLGGRLIAARVAGPRLQQGFALIAGAVAVGLAAHSLLGI